MSGKRANQTFYSFDCEAKSKNCLNLIKGYIGVVGKSGHQLACSCLNLGTFFSFLQWLDDIIRNIINHFSFTINNSYILCGFSA